MARSMTHGVPSHSVPSSHIEIDNAPIETAERAHDFGQPGDVSIPLDFSFITNPLIDLLRDIRDFTQITAEAFSPDNIFQVDVNGLADGSGNCLLSFAPVPLGFTDRLERIVIQNPGGSDVFIFRNLPGQYLLTSLGTQICAHIIDYASSANPVAVFDQTSLPRFYGGETLSVYTRGAVAATGINAKLSYRRSTV